MYARYITNYKICKFNYKYYIYTYVCVCARARVRTHIADI